MDVEVVGGDSDERSKRDDLKRVAKFEPWKKHDRLTLLRTDVSSMETLGHIAEHGPPADRS